MLVREGIRATIERLVKGSAGYTLRKLLIYNTSAAWQRLLRWRKVRYVNNLGLR